ncbi:MAG: DUF5666 domain-containing protein [Burkholderiales bacterium]|jgi:hypothetical protein
MRTPFRSTPSLVAAAVAAALLAACGGGGSDPAAGASAAAGADAAAASTSAKNVQIAAGTITGFGSVIVDGVKFDDSSATVKIERDAASPQSASLGELKLGMRVEVQADASGKATGVTVASEVFGRIASVAADGFVVAGQTVKVSTDAASPTVFEGVAGLSGLVAGDFVEVHGSRDANDVIVASRVERKDPSTAVAIRVAGTVSGLSTTAKTFTVGGLTVKWTDTTRLLPAGVALADGQRVAVWSDAAIAGDNSLVARSIVVRKPSVTDAGGARVGGSIRKLAFDAKTFEVDGVSVDASSATFLQGSATDLANGRKVRVRGSFVAGVLKATEVRFVKDQGDAAVELTGVVTDFAGTRFKVRGVPVDVSGSDVKFEGGTAANLADGVLVKIAGVVVGDAVKPTQVEFVTSGDARTRWLFAEVSGYDATSGRFKVMGLDARLAQAATFRNADGGAATRADFTNGSRVQVRGALDAGVFVVTEVVFRTGMSLTVNDIEGSAYDVDLTAGVFKLNGTVVRIGPSTVFEGTRTNLRNGVKVEVTGAVVAGELVATKVEIEGLPTGDVMKLRGPLTDVVSASNFRVAGQRVDAGTARVEPNGASLSAASEGRAVEVEGTIADGVLKATKLQFK